MNSKKWEPYESDPIFFISVYFQYCLDQGRIWWGGKEIFQAQGEFKKFSYYCSEIYFRVYKMNTCARSRNQ